MEKTRTVAGINSRFGVRKFPSLTKVAADTVWAEGSDLEVDLFNERPLIGCQEWRNRR